MIVRKGATMKRIGLLLLLVGSGGAHAQELAPPPPPPPSPSYAPPPAHHDKGQKERGFALELNIGTHVVDFTAVGTTATIGLISGGFFAGYKIDRFIFGLGFDLGRVASNNSSPGSDTSQAETSFFFVPGVRVAIFRSQDQRVDLFGQFDLGLGTVVNEESPKPTGTQPDVTRFRLNYNIGPGVRFWAHPSFAIGALVGVHGDYAYNKTTVTVGTVSQSTSTSSTITAIFAAIQLMGVF
jgi:hypothetical protein